MFTKFPAVAVKSDGAKVPFEAGKGFNLGVGTYYVDISIPDVSFMSIHVMWDSAVVATSINVQDSNRPDFKTPTSMSHDPDAGVDIALNDAATGATLGAWVTQDPSTAYVPGGSGFTVTNMTIAVAGGTANGTILNIGNVASRRRRVKFVLTTGGFVYCIPHGVGA